MCRKEHHSYQEAVDHINIAHEDGGTDVQTDTVVVAEDGLQQGSVVVIEQDGQPIGMAVKTYE